MAKLLKNMVGLPRFELGTSCTPSKRDTRLRYSPTLKNNVLILAQGVWRTFRDSRASRLAGSPEALALPRRYQRHVNLLINLLGAVGKPRAKCNGAAKTLPRVTNTKQKGFEFAKLRKGVGGIIQAEPLASLMVVLRDSHMKTPIITELDRKSVV